MSGITAAGVCVGLEMSRYQNDVVYREKLKATARAAYRRKVAKERAGNPEARARHEALLMRKAQLAAMSPEDRRRENETRRDPVRRREYQSEYRKARWQAHLDAMTSEERSAHDALVARRAVRAQMTDEERREDTRRRHRDHKLAVYERDAVLIAERGRKRREDMTPEERRDLTRQKKAWQRTQETLFPEKARHRNELEALRRSRPEHKDRHAKEAKKNHRWTKYGLSPEAEIALAQSQGNDCPVCGKPLPVNLNRAAIDHDHELKTQRGRKADAVRGMLHIACNAAIGKLGDNAAGLRHALAYLENWERTHVREAL